MKIKIILAKYFDPSFIFKCIYDPIINTVRKYKITSKLLYLINKNISWY